MFSFVCWDRICILNLREGFSFVSILSYVIIFRKRSQTGEWPCSVDETDSRATSTIFTLFMLSWIISVSISSLLIDHGQECSKFIVERQSAMRIYTLNFVRIESNIFRVINADRRFCGAWGQIFSSGPKKRL